MPTPLESIPRLIMDAFERRVLCVADQRGDPELRLALQQAMIAALADVRAVMKGQVEERE